MVGAIDLDAPGGSYNIASEPSPSTVMFINDNDAPVFMTVSGGFTAMSFQYTSDVGATFTLYPNVRRAERDLWHMDERHGALLRRGQVGEHLGVYVCRRHGDHAGPASDEPAHEGTDERPDESAHEAPDEPSDKGPDTTAPTSACRGRKGMKGHMKGWLHEEDDEAEGRVKLEAIASSL